MWSGIISYWVIPIFSGFVWLGMLLGMLLWWTVDKNSEFLRPMSQGQHIAYISDIGAHQLQPLFIAAGTVTVVTFNMVFIAERWLRHKGRLAENTSTTQKVLSVCSIIAAVIGGIGLICLTCLNDVHHHTAHDVFLVVFIGGYIISAIFICAEYQRLGIHYREFRVLRASFWIKLLFILLECALVVAFGVLDHDNKHNGAAVVEWIIALVYTFYVWSFALDFIPAVQRKNYRSGDIETEMAPAMEQVSNAQEQEAYANRYANGYSNGDGMANGAVDGAVNGAVEGTVDGTVNGTANGTVNVGVNGQPLFKPEQVPAATNF